MGVQGCIQDFFQGGANLEYVKKRGGEAVRSCRAAAGGWVYLEIQGGARITQEGANAPPPPLNTPLGVVNRRQVWLVGRILGVVRMYRCG